MNKKANTPDQANAAQPRFVPFILIAALGLAFFSWQIAVFTLVGLLPTFVFAYTGVGPWKFEKAQCLAICNIASVVPVVLPLWTSPDRFEMMITDPISIAIAFVGAGVGYALLFIGPIVAAIVLQGLSKERLSRLTKQRKDLIDQWGGELIGGTATPEK